jgi:hypothetical protein
MSNEIGRPGPQLTAGPGLTPAVTRVVIQTFGDPILGKALD